MKTKANLKDKLSLFTETWAPKMIGEVDGYHIKIAKTEGEFVWHAHDNEDEFFYCIEGRFRLKFRDRDDAVLDAGDVFVVPKGVEHCPVAEPTGSVMMIERAGTVNTGTADHERAVTELEYI